MAEASLAHRLVCEKTLPPTNMLEFFDGRVLRIDNE